MNAIPADKRKLPALCRSCASPPDSRRASARSAGRREVHSRGFGVALIRERRYAGSGRILRRRKYLPSSPGRQEAPVGRLGRCLAGILDRSWCMYRRVPRQLLRRSVAAGVAWCASGRRCSVLISARGGRGAGCANRWRAGFAAAPPIRHSAVRGCLRQRRTARTRPCNGERT